MAWKIEFEKEAERELDSLDFQTAKRIVVFLRERVAKMQDPRDIAMQLRGPKFGNLWRFRVGHYRVVSSIENDKMRILVVRVGHRSRVYE